MSNIWVTSDWHFNHDKEFIWKARGFNSISEMNEAIVERCKHLIKDEDTVYVLGDCMMSADAAAGIELIKQIPGHKFLALGNHDTDSRVALYKQNNLFEDICWGYMIKKGKKKLLLTHYPTLVSNGETSNGIYNIHGHTHSKDKVVDTLPYCYNVNLDAHDCYPVNLEEIKL